MRLLFQQEFFSDNSTAVSHILSIECRSREFKLDFSETLPWSNHTEMAGRRTKGAKIIEPKEAGRNIRGVLDFVGSYYLITIKPKYVNSTQNTLELCISKWGKGFETQISQTLSIPDFVMIIVRNPDVIAHFTP
jgi:hypothetical protein